jgi:hypothetical protein
MWPLDSANMSHKGIGNWRGSIENGLKSLYSCWHGYCAIFICPTQKQGRIHHFQERRKIDSRSIPLKKLA